MNHDRSTTPDASDSRAGGPSLSRGALNWRSILLGLVGVTLICTLTPYNDYVMGNTYVVGNFMPVGLLLFFMVVIMLLNAPLHRWRRRWAFTGGELAVSLAMVLVSCSLPSSGLMRYLPSSLVGLNYHAASHNQRLQMLQELDLPHWMFPAVEGETVRARAGSLIYRDFYGRLSSVPSDAPLSELLAAIPWQAWVQPAITWGLLLASLFGAVICLMIILRHQWAENERLAFPLATVYSALIQDPAPGRSLNDLFRCRGFWIAFGAIFAIHALNGLSEYSPQYFPSIPIDYNLGDIFANEPWRYMLGSAKASTLYFSVIGFTYFIQTNVAFSLWFLLIGVQVAHMQVGMMQGDFTDPMKQDQTMGAVVVFAAMTVWVGRHHWAMVIRQMIRGAGGNEPRGRYLSYRAAGWLLVICLIGMTIWLCLAGMTVVGAAVLTLMILTFFLVLARVVAETGLIFVQINVPLIRPLIYVLNDLPESIAHRTVLQDYFFFRYFERLFTSDMREALPVFASNALRVGDLQIYDQRPRASSALGFTAVLLLALVVGFLVSGASMLYVEYSHAAPLGRTGSDTINNYAINSTPTAILDFTQTFRDGGTGPKENHNRPGHFLTGAAITTLLSVLRLRYVNWPLHPIGFLLVYSYPMGTIWFSIFVGWLAKTLLVKFGGAQLYRSARPYFIGMIIGEAAAAALWLVVSLVRSAQGLPFEAINLLPA